MVGRVGYTYYSTVKSHYFVVFFLADFGKNYELVALFKKMRNFIDFC